MCSLKIVHYILCGYVSVSVMRLAKKMSFFKRHGVVSPFCRFCTRMRIVHYILCCFAWVSVKSLSKNGLFPRKAAMSQWKPLTATARRRCNCVWRCCCMGLFSILSILCSDENSSLYSLAFCFGFCHVSIENIEIFRKKRRTLIPPPSCQAGILFILQQNEALQ